MGSHRKYHRKRFFARHSRCCFCGGEEVAVEIDHVPSRALFSGRHWPEGYEFPACVRCNRFTRYEEQTVALLSRLHPGPETEEEKQEFEGYASAVYQRQPEIIAELQPSMRQLRNFVKEHEITLGLGESYTDIPVMSLTGVRTNAAVSEFGRKLFLALFYMHTRAPLPATGGVAVKWYSNAQVANGAIPHEFAELMREWPALQRCNTSLKGQFSYSYSVDPGGKFGAFMAIFRTTFVVIGIVHADRAVIEGPNRKVLGVYGAGQA